MLRVLHIDTERGWRGGERQVLWLARELARMGHVCIVAARPGEPLAERGARAGLHVAPCAPAGELDVRAAFALRRLLRSERIDIVHAHTAHAVSLAAFATLGTDIPVVAARRVDFPLKRNIGTRWKYGRAAAIIAVSDAVAHVLRQSGIPGARIAVVSDGTDVHRAVTSAGERLIASIGISGRPLIVQVAQLVSHKDPLNFVHAVAAARESVPTLQALLVGDGPLRPAVEAEVARLGLHGVLHVAGYRTDADALLASADVACLSSREEGLGSVLLDALVFGVPVAATRAGGIPEVVQDGITGLLAPIEAPRDLGDAIARIAGDAPLRTRMAEASRRRAPEFSVERMAQRTLEIYEKVLGTPGARRQARARSASSESSDSVTGAP